MDMSQICSFHKWAISPYTLNSLSIIFLHRTSTLFTNMRNARGYLEASGCTSPVQSGVEEGPRSSPRYPEILLHFGVLLENEKNVLVLDRLLPCFQTNRERKLLYNPHKAMYISPLQEVMHAKKSPPDMRTSDPIIGRYQYQLAPIHDVE